MMSRPTLRHRGAPVKHEGGAMSDTVTLQVIARVRNGRTSAEDANWGKVESRIEVDPEFAAGLEGLDQFSHAVVVFHMHLDPNREPATLQRRPRGRADMPLVGVFAQRGRMRPNPVGVTSVKIVRVEPGAVIVRGLDAIDGTPVLDLKPYAPVFDRHDDARVPDWLDRLMQGYF
jgi:tRNA-Thr(GGU) m(6)t(6)A37 methyltransferase TsaA